MYLNDSSVINKPMLLDFLNDDKIFPRFFPSEPDLMNEKVELSISEIENLHKTHIISQDVLDFINKKLELLIFSNPFLTTIEKYTELYLKLFKNYPKRPIISQFINSSKICGIPAFIQDIQIDPTNKLQSFKIARKKPGEKYLALLVEIFAFNEGKIPNLEKMLLWFPDYLMKFQETYQILMYGEGPLSVSIRFFIALMAVSAYGCDYLVSRLVTDFLKNGGDVEWLEGGLANCPKKLQKLSELNLVLAYSPWKLKDAKFFAENAKGELYWSKNEIVQAACILAFHHSLACFCISNGLFQEEDFNIINLRLNAPVQELLLIPEKEIPAQESFVINYLKSYSSESDKDSKKVPVLEQKVESKQEIEEDTKKKNEIVNDKAVDISKIIKFYEFFERFLFVNKGETFFSENFDWHFFKGLKSYVIFYIIPIIITSSKKDCSWQNNTYCFINEFFPDLAQILDEKFRYVQKMTNMEFEGQNVNTDPFRRAIWNYSQYISGYVYSNYDYIQINKCIPRSYKAFIRKIITNPGSINIETFTDIPLNFQPFEYTQSSLLAIEAKCELTLIYAMLVIEELL